MRSLALASQDVEDDVGRVHALAQRLGAGGLHRGQAIRRARRSGSRPSAGHRRQSRELAPDRSRAAGRTQSLNVCRAQRARLAGEHGDVVPGIEHRLVAAEDTGVLGTIAAAVLADLDALGIGSNLDWTADADAATE